MKRIYLDYAATTPIDPQVVQAMLPFLKQMFGNPSTLYSDGQLVNAAIKQARTRAAKIINSQAEEIIFCGSGTESDNLAILGVARFYRNKGQHVITTNIEHHAVLHTVEHLKKKDFAIDFVPVKSNGIVDPADILRKIKKETTLISVMYVNNEIGTIQPLRAIAKKIKEWKKRNNRSSNEPPFFHTDACQAAGYLDLDVQKLGVDLLTLNGSKIYGPKGMGMLYLKKGIQLEPLMFGGGQERKLRPGTENTAGIIGFATALELVQKKRAKEGQRLKKLRDYFIKELIRRIPKVIINGDPVKRSPNNVNISILDIEGEAVLLHLDKLGIEASSGSACDSENLEPSHVILALGRPYEYAHGSLRFTMGQWTSKKDIDYVLKILPPIVKKLRSISPLDIKPKLYL